MLIAGRPDINKASAHEYQKAIIKKANSMQKRDLLNYKVFRMWGQAWYFTDAPRSAAQYKSSRAIRFAPSAEKECMAGYALEEGILRW